MKGDFSRHTFDPARHFTTVRLQQGRVQLDADANEQADLTLHRIETEAADTIGGCGAPLDAAAFGITNLVPDDFVLTPGRFYVDGILCESERPVPYTRQPDRPVLKANAFAKGFTIVYLDVWQRHITFLDDPLLRETALGGPDTATRTKTVWQVRTVHAGANKITCADNPAPYLAAIADSAGLMAARAKHEDDAPDPCLVPASAGYRGLENQLYRVEIHDPGTVHDLTAGPEPVTITVSNPNEIVVPNTNTWKVGDRVEIFRSAPGSDPMEGFLAFVVTKTSTTLTLNTTLPILGPADQPKIRRVDATFKWSRDNGSVVTLVTSVTGSELSVAGLGPDDALGFAPGQWVELIDDDTEFDGKPGFLSPIADVDRAARTVTLASTPTAFTGKHLKLRRWDGVGAVKTNPPGAAEPYVELEDGVQVTFSEGGTYNTADHWLIPARTATVDERSGTIEWPTDADEPRAVAPLGIRHHYCKLAILEKTDTTLTAVDCRPLFPPLTQLATLVYVGGDGQEARPGTALPQLLQVGVFRGRRAVAGARVRFATSDGGTLTNLGSEGSPGANITVATGADGLAGCAWLPASTKLSQRVAARLLDPGGVPLDPQVNFNAQLSVAKEVEYEPGECPDLAAAKTVQEALDILCKRPSGGCCRVVEPDTSLDEIIKEFAEQGVRDICLCLKPGDYTLGAFGVGDKEFDTLSIEGCCPGTRVRIVELACKRLRAVALRGLDITLVDTKPLTFDGCADITIEDCQIAHADKSGQVLVVAGARRLRIAGCTLNGHVGVDDGHIDELRDLLVLPELDFALKVEELAQRLSEDADARRQLALAISRAERTDQLSQAEQTAYRQLVEALLLDVVEPSTIVGAIARLRIAAKSAFEEPTLVLQDGGAEALIERSDIIGALALYGATAGKLLTKQPADNVSVALRSGTLEFRGLGSLHVRDVRVSKVTCSEELLKLLPPPNDAKTTIDMLRALHIVDTEILQNDNVFVARDGTLTGVDFAADELGIAGELIADSAAVVANRARPAPQEQARRLFVVSNAQEAAANVRINVGPP